MKIILLFLLLTCIASCQKNGPDNPVNTADNFIRAADLSALPEIEQAGTQFYASDNQPKDALTILKESGCNTIRLRLWYNPSTNHSSLSEVAEFAKKIRQNNLKLLLSIHYSDTWADPGQQTPPIAWAGLTENILNDSVYNYTKRALLAIQPDYVQIGNEINDGFLWETGRIINTAPFVRLLKSGIRAVRDFNNGTKIIIHFAGLSGSAWFYSQLKNNTVDYDIIGLSYYPIWHGKSLDLLQTTMRDLHTAYQKPVMITETAYPFTLNWNDNTNNVLGLASQIIPEFPASEQGQLQFMQALIQRIKLVTDGAGFCYWGGEWVAFKGNTSTSGSPWENQALFNFNNKALPVMEAFRK
jgi:arabinogalactan endo-1,4-beta-galactosidase